MDSKTLETLKTAFSATPNNDDLLMVILRAHDELDLHSEGVAFLRQHRDQLNFEKDEDRLDLANLCLNGGDYEAVLEICDEDAPQENKLRALAFLELDRLEEAAESYKQAIAANATLQDKAIEARLKVRSPKRVIRKEGAEPVKLRVISNDDTDVSEMNRLLNPAEETVTFEDVGGLDAVKKQIHKRIILPFQKPSLFERFRKRSGGGILLYGPPGCGKTLLARATAGECNAEFFNVAISDILDMYIGESERKLAAIFQKARSTVPSVLFFDEIEALGGKRQNTRESTSSKLVSQFLSELDGFSKDNKGVLILGATNVPWSIDPAFRRPGRFDRVLFVPPPDREARKTILDIHLKNRPITDDIDTKALAAITSGFSGADLSELVETGVDEAIEASLASGNEEPVSHAMLTEALKEVKATTSEWLTTARNYARYANEGGQYDEVLDFLKKHGKN